MKNLVRPHHRGVTLLELTVVILLGLLMAGMLMGLAQQQITFLNLLSRQNFLVDEAPLLNNYINRVISKADRFSVHAAVPAAGARVADAAILGAGPTLKLTYNLPDGTNRESVLYFRRAALGNPGGLFLRTFQPGAGGALNTEVTLYSATSVTTNIIFSIGAVGSPNAGLLVVTLNGPQNETIAFAGTTQQ
ncbi:MAG: hypothetical protein HC845_05205 [Akkermansiaceae bacterium]|nr:hypothetical protein [Akkermansiaceae bacterium]